MGGEEAEGASAAPFDLEWWAGSEEVFRDAVSGEGGGDTRGGGRGRTGCVWLLVMTGEETEPGGSSARQKNSSLTSRTGSSFTLP